MLDNLDFSYCMEYIGVAVMTFIFCGAEDNVFGLSYL